MKSNFWKKCALLSLSSVFYSQAFAVDLDTGDYVTAPAGTNVALLYLQHAQRDALYDGGKKVQGDNQLESNIGIFRYVYYTKLGQYTIAPQVLVPFGQLKADKDLSVLGKTQGLGDIILAMPLWVKEDKTNQEYLGITPYLYLPTGKYSENAGLNLGENRYKLVLQAGYVKNITDQIQWDLAGDMTFYGDNDEYAKHTTLKQDLGYQLQTSLKYQLKDSIDVRTGISYAYFGDTKVESIKMDAAEQSKIWVGSNFTFTPTTHLLMTVGKDLDVDNTFKENFRVNFRFLYAF